MKVLIKHATVLDKNSDYHLKKRDILIDEGIIVTVANEIEEKDAHRIEGQDLHCSIGLCDIGTHIGEPGLEHRETLNSLTKAARKGGYSVLAVFSNEVQPVQSVVDVEWLKSRNLSHHVKILPVGVLTSHMKGTQMIDYMDLSQAGIVGFSDGLNSVDDTGLFLRILEYTSTQDTCVFHHPSEKALRKAGHMHEGRVSTQLGLKGIPDIAELIMAQRDILIAEFLNRELVLHAISAGRTVDAIEKARHNHINIKATVPYLNLIFTDEDVQGFDTALKVQPVLRTEDDRKSLINGLKHHVIDAIITNHVPLEDEEKRVEFPYATPGAVGLETCLCASIDILKGDWAVADILEKLTVAPRQILGITVPTIEVGQSADLCVWDMNNPWKYNQDNISSLSRNSPFTGHTFQTRVIASIVGDDVVTNI